MCSAAVDSTVCLSPQTLCLAQDGLTSLPDHNIAIACAGFKTKAHYRPVMIIWLASWEIHNQER